MDNQIDHARLLRALETDKVIAAAQSAELHDSGNTAHDFAKHAVSDSGKPIIGSLEKVSVGIADEAADGIFARGATEIPGTQESVKPIQIRHSMSDGPRKDTARDVAPHKVRHDTRLGSFCKPLRETDKAGTARVSVGHDGDMRPFG